MAKTISIKKMYYFEVPSGQFGSDGKEKNWWFLTTDEEEAKSTDPDYRLADEDDLNDAGCIGWKYNDFVIRTSAGDYVWFEKSYKNALMDFDEFESGYERVELGEEFLDGYKEKNFSH